MLNEKYDGRGCQVGALRKARGETGRPTEAQLDVVDDLLASQRRDGARVLELMEKVKADRNRSMPAEAG